ncbi:MAG: CHASE2 domain-containing protein [Oceanospirillaceae bacterium]|nr:CHASE2 domain-containing protein [Oceanospirillaceae bacterium]
MGFVNQGKRIAIKTRSAIFPLHRSWLVPLGVLLLGACVWLGVTPMQQTLRTTNIDLYQQLMPRARVSSPALIVDIDEASLGEYGQWPWPRDLMAELVSKVSSYSPAAIGLDLLLPEEDRSTACSAIGRLSTLSDAARAEVCSAPSNDAQLAQALFSAPTVLGVAGLEVGDESELLLQEVLVESELNRSSIRAFPAHLSSLPLLHQAASGWGLVSADMERGVIQQIPLMGKVSEQLIPALSVELLRVGLRVPNVRLIESDDMLALSLGDLTIQLQAEGTAYLHYSPHEPDRFVSARDVLGGKLDPQLLQGRLVLIGVSGLGLVDYVSTPLGERIPGVEVHTQVLETIFDDTMLVYPPWAQHLETLIIVLVSLWVIYLLSRLRVWLQLSLFLLTVVGVAGLGIYLFSAHGTLIDVLTPTVYFSILYFAQLTDELVTGEEKIDDLEFAVLERTKKMMQLQDVAMEAMGALAESRDPETGNHIRRTQNYVKLLAEYLSLREEYAAELTPSAITHLYKTAPLHDIGKVGIPDDILMKPGKLTDEEFEIMKRHPEYGKRAIESAEQKMDEPSEFLRYAKEIIYAHHEKWDGSGYPEGLAGGDIPLSARLMALADVYDALICRRCYKPPFPHEKAVAIILEGRGTHFDPTLVDAFLEISEQFYEISLKYEDKEEDFHIEK